MKNKHYTQPETECSSALCSELLANSFSDGEPIIGPQSIDEDFLIIPGGQFYE